MPRYRVVVEWTDSGDGTGVPTEDADEVVIVADTQDAALQAARRAWRVTVGAEWPKCRMTLAYVLTPEKLAEFA